MFDPRACIRCVLITVGGLLFAVPGRAQVNFTALRAWGLETYQETDRTLRIPGSQLFAETASLNGALSGGFDDRAFVWPTSTEFRVLNTLAQMQAITYVPTLRTFADELHT